MNNSETCGLAKITAGDIVIECGANGTRLFDTGSGQWLIHSLGGWPLVPILDGQILPVEFLGIVRLNEGVQITLRVDAKSPVETMLLICKPSRESIELCCEFKVRAGCQLNSLNLFPARTGLNLYDVINFRNRHFASAVWPELLIGQALTTGTYSDDWQFAPHPTAILLRKNEVSLFAGFSGLQASFGMRMEVKQSLVSRWDVNFGDSPHGLALGKGETFRSAPLRLFLKRNQTPYEVFAGFGQMLVEEGAIADPARKERPDWWMEPVYCTWGDQWMLANEVPAVSLQDQTAASATTATEVLTTDMVRQAVSVIKREQLPVRTIILDEGWEVVRGDWRPHPERLPNLRGLIDELHEAGFKVLVWWNWAEIAEDAQVDPRHLAGNGWRNKHGNRFRDYSDPLVQEEYLKPLFRTLMSPEKGCLDLDGVKTDFLADKVHPEMPLADAAWRGEEIYFRKITELFYGEIRKYKPEGIHLGCSGNYWLAGLIDLNRTYDVHSSNWMEHEARARMLTCTSPGAIPSYDMMTCSENTERWFESARRSGAGVEIGNVLAVRDDVFSRTRPADHGYLSMLREQMRRMMQAGESLKTRER